MDTRLASEIQKKSDEKDGIIDLPNGRKEKEADLKGYVVYYLQFIAYC